MTCIVGLCADEGVYLSGDSAWSDNAWLAVSKTPKVFAHPLSDGTPFGVGVCGNPRVGQVLLHGVAWDTIDPPDSEAVEPWMVNELIPQLRDALGEHEVSNEKPGSVDANLLVAVSGRLFSVFNEWQFSERDTPYDAVGSGQDAALGALHALTSCESGLTPSMIVMAAMHASALYNGDVEPPFTTIFVPARQSM